MNLAEAQRTAREQPKLKAAVVRSEKRARVGAGITDDPDCTVELYPLVGSAQAALKATKESLEAEGYTVAFGTLSRGILIMERGEDAVSFAMVKRQTPRKGDGA